MLRIAFFTIYWLTFGWLEWYFTILLAICASSFVHFTWTKISSESSASASSTAKTSASAAFKSAHFFTSWFLFNGYLLLHFKHLYSSVVTELDFLPNGKFLCLINFASEPHEQGMNFLVGCLFVNLLVPIYYLIMIFEKK